jgi:hypothetical protein
MLGVQTFAEGFHEGLSCLGARLKLQPHVSCPQTSQRGQAQQLANKQGQQGQ